MEPIKKPRHGRVVILTGPGKGKSSSAFGMVMRAAGWGMRVCVIQFIKGQRRTGEQQAAARFPEIVWHIMGHGFTWDTQDPEGDRAAARAAWGFAREQMTGGGFDLVVLDEILYAIGFGWITPEEVAESIRNEKPDPLHLVLTGRGAPEALVAVADTVTSMEPVKHAFAEGIPAAKGIEF